MIKKKVPLDNIEKKLIQIAYTSNEKTLDQKFDWKLFFVASVVGILGFYILFFQKGLGVHWLFFIIMAVAFATLYNQITTYSKEKKPPYWREKNYLS